MVRARSLTCESVHNPLFGIVNQKAQNEAKDRQSKMDRKLRIWAISSPQAAGPSST
jgi:hypothetical protein